MKLVITIILVSFCAMSSGQRGGYQNLLDSAVVAKKSKIVFSKPGIVDGLESYEMVYYAERYWGSFGKKLDTVMFSQIIRNVTSPDTTIWKDDELAGSILIHRMDENVSVKALIKKLGLSDEKEIAYYKKADTPFQ